MEKKSKEWREGEMILTFSLKKINDSLTTTMQEWLTVDVPAFGALEEETFQKLVEKSVRIANWSEEDLKMKFISDVLDLGHLLEEDTFVSFFDKKFTAEVEGHHLFVKADFVIGSGVLDYLIRPFFHFQEYKPQKNPTGDPMAQLLQAFLIAQTHNKKDNKNIPLYGCEIIGKQWTFIVMEEKNYCVSPSYDATKRHELYQIIAILRKFREILETRLMKM